MNEKNSYWYQLKDDFIDFLREKGYSKSSFTHYRGQIDFLIRYANALGYTEYSPEIGQAFLESEARLREWNPKALSFKATVIRRLDEYINGRNYTFARLRIFYQCPEGFESVLEAFLQTLRDGGYKEITIRQYHTQLVKMLRCFSENGITSWEVGKQGDIRYICLKVFCLSCGTGNYCRQLFRHTPYGTLSTEGAIRLHI